MRISDWSSDVCSSDLEVFGRFELELAPHTGVAEAVDRAVVEHVRHIAIVVRIGAGKAECDLFAQRTGNTRASPPLVAARVISKVEKPVEFIAGRARANVYRTDRSVLSAEGSLRAAQDFAMIDKIGKAQCRERVCQIV